MVFARGAVYNVKRTGPRTDPWGTSQESLIGLDLVSSTKLRLNGTCPSKRAVSWIPNNFYMLEAGEKNRVVHGVESSRKIEECKETDLARV